MSRFRLRATGNTALEQTKSHAALLEIPRHSEATILPRAGRIAVQTNAQKSSELPKFPDDWDN